MRETLDRLALLALIGVTSASCITLYDTRSGIAADPLFLEDRGEAVFRQYQIPVAEHAANYRVYSGDFMVDEVWGPGGAERVTCGMDSNGGPLVRGARVRMAVTLRISYRNNGSRIALTSSGRTMPTPESDESTRCRLRRDFTEEILSAVAGDLPGDLGRPGLGLPGVWPPRDVERGGVITVPAGDPSGW